MAFTMNFLLTLLLSIFTLTVLSESKRLNLIFSTKHIIPVLVIGPARVINISLGSIFIPLLITKSFGNRLFSFSQKLLA